MKREYVTIALKSLVILLGCICVGALLMFTVFALPTENIEENVNESIVIFENEQTYPRLFNWCTSHLDNFTDALMLLSATYQSEDTNVEKAMKVNRIMIKGSENPTESLILQYRNPDIETHEVGYARYWHGYLIFLKPLLIFFNYSGIRLFNIVVQTLVTVAIAWLLYKNNLKKYIVPYVLSILMLMPLVTASSLQFSTVFYLLSLGSMVLLLKNDSWRASNKYIYLFLILGSMTSYFDLLTYPLATFGIPATLYFIMNRMSDSKEALKKLCLYLIFWGIGYIGMWAGKWILASLLTDNNVILNALNALKIRTSMSASGESFSILEVLARNFAAFLFTPVTIIVFVFMLFLWKKSNQNKKYKGSKILVSCKGSVIALSCIAILPFIWYIVASNHSFVHFWFTYRLLIVSIFAILSAMTLVTTNK